MQTSKDEPPALFHVPAVEQPSIDDIRRISNELGLRLSPCDIPHYRDKICGILKSFDTIENLPEPILPVKYARTPGYRPHPDDNPLNAWEWRCEVRGADSGKLHGYKIAIKNNAAVAGVPLSVGSKMLSSYIPEYDASVVTRILDEGGVILGMASCEDLCYSGSSFHNVHGPVLNPIDKTRTAGGSSGGSAALVAAGDVHMALGGDQGGSIRIPSCWCGIVGLKPTFGLVPYTGIVSIEPSVDHAGPMARSVADCALMLEVLAGYDSGLDPRQPVGITVPEYSKLLTGDVSGMRVAVIEDGFENCEVDVERIVRSAITTLATKVAKLENISFPEQKTAFAVWSVICFKGFYNTVIKNQGVGTGYKGFYPTSLTDALSAQIKAEPHRFGEECKLAFVTGRHIDESCHGRFYGKAQNILRGVMQKYDELFTRFDVLVMPTLTHVAPKLPTTETPIDERFEITTNMLQNTGPYDATGHPAITVPVGRTDDGLPVGLMIVGRHFDEVTVLNVAKSCEITGK